MTVTSPMLSHSVLKYNPDVIKTRVQTWDLISHPQASSLDPAVQPLLRSDQQSASVTTKLSTRPSSFQIAREAYTAEGMSVFFRGLGICSARAFMVNAVQWAVSNPHPLTQQQPNTY